MNFTYKIFRKKIKKPGCRVNFRVATRLKYFKNRDFFFWGKLDYTDHGVTNINLLVMMLTNFFITKA